MRAPLLILSCFKGIHPQHDNFRPPCQEHSSWGKTETIVTWPPPPGYILQPIPQPSSLSLSLLSLLVRTDLQEPGCWLWAIPRVPSRFQGITKWWITWLLQGICLSLPVSPGGLAAGFSVVTSHCVTRLLGHSAILCHQSLGETTGEKGTPFCQPVPLSTPILW